MFDQDSYFIIFINWFVLLYPLGMSLIWLVGSIWHYSTRERINHYTFEEQPSVSILVPAYNEEETIHNVIDRLHKLNYLDLEIIVINDGSKDNTAKVIESVMHLYPKLRFVNSEKNGGKANALWLGFLASNGEYLIGVDADSYLDDNAIRHLIAPMLAENNGLNVGAVTGNPKIRNRTNLLSKIQTAEYATIMGMIKRTQQMNNNCMTVSGVCVAFRKTALLDVGLWDKDMITEDIAVTWKLHSKKWKIIFSPSAICWMLVPEKLPGLFKQRVRWSLGGVEVLNRHFFPAVKRKDYRNLVLLIEQAIGIFWAFSYISIVPFMLADMINGDYSIPLAQLKMLTFISLLNFLVAFFIERKYDMRLFRSYFWVIWYPAAYWIFNVFVTITAVFKFLINKMSKKTTTHATWESPDRGEPNNLGVIEEDILTIGGTKYDKWIFGPFSVLMWSLFIYAIFNAVYTILSNMFIYEESFYAALINNQNAIYVLFVTFVLVVGILVLYQANVLFWFPHLPKHVKKVDTYQETCHIFNKKDIKKEKNSKHIIIGGEDEINIL